MFTVGQQVVASEQINVWMTGRDTPMIMAEYNDDLIIDEINGNVLVVHNLGNTVQFTVTTDQVR